MAINKEKRCKKDQLFKIRLDATEYCFSLYIYPWIVIKYKVQAMEDDS